MPYKENMKNKKGIALEAFARIILMLLLFFVVFKIGGTAAEAFYGGSDAKNSFEEFVKKINSIPPGGNIFLLSMDKNTAVFGFRSSAKDFKCYGCDQGPYYTKLLYHSMDKPSNLECDGKACVCLCTKGFGADATTADGTKLKCSNFICRTINIDLLPKISLEKALKDKGISIATYPYWENGFYFSRGNNLPSNGLKELKDDRRASIWIEKGTIENQLYVAACPSNPCATK